jgi:very-short-patch-repair endonuclease
MGFLPPRSGGSVRRSSEGAKPDEGGAERSEAMRNSERKTVNRARSLRKRMTDAEVILWSRLQRHAAGGFHFRKQHPIGPYVADFACTRAHLVVEVDGETHSTVAEREHDRKRDLFLKAQGWRVLRVTNEDVYKRLDMVIEGIALQLEI